MGQSNSKYEQINAHKPRDDEDPNFERIVRPTFKKLAQQGALRHHSCQEGLRVLENYNMIKLCGTPLGNRIFAVIDKDKKQEIPIEGFLSAIQSLMNDREKRILCT
jgi:hypothetical protein